MKKQADGFYYEKKVTWKNTNEESLYWIISLIVCLLSATVLIPFLLGLYNLPKFYVNYLVMLLVMTCILGLCSFIGTINILFGLERTVKYKRIGK